MWCHLVLHPTSSKLCVTLVFYTETRCSKYEPCMCNVLQIIFVQQFPLKIMEKSGCVEIFLCCQVRKSQRSSLTQRDIQVNATSSLTYTTIYPSPQSSLKLFSLSSLIINEQFFPFCFFLFLFSLFSFLLFKLICNSVLPSDHKVVVAIPPICYSRL